MQMSYLEKLKKFSEDYKLDRKFENNFSGIFYLVNNYARKKQVEISLAREVSNLKTTISPPEIQQYKTGFLYLAGYLIYGNLSKDNLVLFTEQALNFLLYDILWKYVSENNIYGTDSPENKHRVRNLASDFKKTLAIIYEEEKKEKFEALLNNFNEFENRDVYKCLKYIFKEYNERKKDKKNFNFFSPLESYIELKESLEKSLKEPLRNSVLKVSPEDFNKAHIIIVEDADDMELLFKDILSLLEKKGYNVIRISSNDFRKEIAGNLDLKGFVTTLDEAEYIGYRIKQLLSEKKANEEDISVVSFSNETSQLLNLVFSRFKLISSFPIPVASSEVFSVFNSAIRIAIGKDATENDYIKLLDSKFSSFHTQSIDDRVNVDGNYLRIRELIQKAGYKSSVNQAHNLSGTIEEYINKTDNNEIKKNVKKILDINSYVQREPKNLFSNIFNLSINLKEIQDEGLIKTLLDIVKKADIVLNQFFERNKNNQNGINIEELSLLSSSILSLIGETEYYPKNEDVQNYTISIIKPEEISNTSASYIFVCGLTSEADKLERLPIGEKLTKKIGLSEDNKSYSEIKREKIYKHFANLVKLSCDKKTNLTLTYGYNNLNGDNSGKSNLIRAVMKAEDVQRHYNLKDTKDNSSLYCFYELINEKSPDISYSTFTVGRDLNIDNTKNNKNNVEEKDLVSLVRELDIISILRNKKTKEEQNIGNDGLPTEIYIDVRDFASFINCHRKFIVKNFLIASNIKEEKDFEDKIDLEKGNFWHKVYEKAAKNKEFYSKDKNKIKERLHKAFEELIVIEKKDPETFQEKVLEEFKREAERNFEKFAENELKRQNDLPELKGLELEEKYLCEMGKVKYNNMEIKVFLRGRIDRLDTSNYGNQKWLHIWDYKTGEKKNLSFYSDKKNTEHLFTQQSENALQLALYAYLINNEKNKEKLKLKDFNFEGKITGLNIFNDGTHNGEYQDNAKKIYEAINRIKNIVIPYFLSFLSQKLSILDINPENLKMENFRIHKPYCNYCDYKVLCKFLSLDGGNND